jgi:hypothetical protein
MIACRGGTHANMIHTFFKNAFAKTKPSVTAPSFQLPASSFQLTAGGRGHR